MAVFHTRIKVNPSLYNTREVLSLCALRSSVVICFVGTVTEKRPAAAAPDCPSRAHKHCRVHAAVPHAYLLEMLSSVFLVSQLSDATLSHIFAQICYLSVVKLLNSVS